jgi:hypothetical protein
MAAPEAEEALEHEIEPDDEDQEVDENLYDDLLAEQDIEAMDEDL